MVVGGGATGVEMARAIAASLVVRAPGVSAGSSRFGRHFMAKDWAGVRSADRYWHAVARGDLIDQAGIEPRQILDRDLVSYRHGDIEFQPGIGRLSTRCVRRRADEMPFSNTWRLNASPIVYSDRQYNVSNAYRAGLDRPGRHWLRP